MAIPASDDPFSLIMWKVAEMFSKLLLENAYESCFEIAEEALALADRYGINIRSGSIYSLATISALSLDNFSLAKDYLRRMEALLPNIPRGMGNLYQYNTGWLHFLRGNLRYALTLAEKGLAISMECVTPVPEIFFRQLTAKILHALGERDAAMIEGEGTGKPFPKWGIPRDFCMFRCSTRRGSCSTVKKRNRRWKRSGRR